MSVGLSEFESSLSSLSSEEKVRALQVLVHDIVNAWPGIEKNDRVSGGDACIVRTRIPVWTLEGYRRLGWSDETILENFPSLTANDLANAWMYAGVNTQEIDEAISRNENA